MVQKIRHKKSVQRGRRRFRSLQNMSATAMAARTALVETLEPRALLAADPVISEFQALNVSTLQDEDGDYEDWIEIRNPDVATVDISNWYLTDDDQNLTMWQFPAGTTIPAGEQILVFASNKDRHDGPMGQLHTNFRLSGDGEYLGLVKADGTTVVSDYAPYPAQVEDQSYGLAVSRDVHELIGNQAAVKALVPTNDSLGQTWTDPAFDDASWAAGTGAVGYEELAAGFEVKEAFDTPLGADWTVDVPGAGLGTVQVAGGALVINVPTGQDMDGTSRGIAPIAYRALPGSPADFELITTVSQGTADAGSAGIVVMDNSTGLPAVQLEYDSRRTFRLWAGGENQGSATSLRRQSYSLRLVRDSTAKTWTGYYRLNDTDDWSEVGVATDGIDSTPNISDPRVGLYGRTPSSTMTASFDNFDIIVPDQPPVYGPEIGMDVQGIMQDKNGSIYLRLPFTYDNDPSQLDEMVLTARYDDGFIAYLNGTELTRQNAPIQEAWDSSTQAEFGAVGGQIPIRQFSVSAGLSALKQGQNVLAVQGINVAKEDLDFFFDANLFAADVLAQTPQYFITPTPGLDNELPAAPIPEIVGQQGVFFGSRTIEMRLPDPNPSLQIRYTLDGSVPTTGSDLYSGPLTLNASAMLQARTFDSSPTASFSPSNVVSGTFMALDPALQSVSSDLPVVILSGLGQGLANAGSNDLTAMNVVVFDTSKVDGRASLDSNLIDYMGRGGARDRGSSTAGQPKPNMAFETWGPTGTTKDDDDNVSLLGMTSSSDWVLHAPYTFDRVFMHNQIAFNLSRNLGMWASNYRMVEVYIDSSPRDGKRPATG